MANEEETDQFYDDIDVERTKREWLSEMLRGKVEDRRTVNSKTPITS